MIILKIKFLYQRCLKKLFSVLKNIPNDNSPGLITDIMHILK